MQKIIPSLFLLTPLTVPYVSSVFIFGVMSFYLRVNAEVLSGGKGQSQEVVALSRLLGIKLHQLPQLLHNLLRQQTLIIIKCLFSLFFLTSFLRFYIPLLTPKMS